MQWYSIVSLVVTVLAIPTLVGLFWKDLHEKKKKESEESKNKKRKEERDNIRSVIREENLEIKLSIDSLKSQLDKIGEGTLSTLRNDILTCYYKCVDKGYRNDYDYTNIHDLFQAYEGLHGNSFVKDVMARFDALPTKEEFTSSLAATTSQSNKNTRIKKGDGANG